jgi:hypothetical protein
MPQRITWEFQHGVFTFILVLESAGSLLTWFYSFTIDSFKLYAYKEDSHFHSHRRENLKSYYVHIINTIVSF